MIDPGTSKIVSSSVPYTFVIIIPIMNYMNHVEAEGATVAIPLKLSTGDTVFYQKVSFAIQPGALIVGTTAAQPFPKGATVRWLEMKFKSTDPTDADFLVPDWSDSIISKYVKNAGWKESGVYNIDGATADLGAPSLSESRRLVRNIIPLEPAYILNGRAILHFKLDISDSFPNPKVEYLKLVKNIPYQKNIFGPNGKPVPQNSIIQLPLDISLKPGINTLEIPIPVSDSSDQFGFIEMILSSKNGSSTLNATGFIPYRKFYPQLDIKLLDLVTRTPITEIKKGDKILLNVSVVNNDTTTFHAVKIRLFSGEKIFRADGGGLKIDSLSSNVFSDTISFNHSGTDAIVVSAIDTLGGKAVWSVNCSPLFTILESTTSIHKKPIESLVVKNLKYVLFSLNGKRVGAFSINQLRGLRSSKSRLVPSGTYCAFPEADAINGRLLSGSMKVIVP